MSQLFNTISESWLSGTEPPQHRQQICSLTFYRRQVWWALQLLDLRWLVWLLSSSHPIHMLLSTLNHTLPSSQLCFPGWVINMSVMITCTWTWHLMTVGKWSNTHIHSQNSSIFSWSTLTSLSTEIQVEYEGSKYYSIKNISHKYFIVNSPADNENIRCKHLESQYSYTYFIWLSCLYCSGLRTKPCSIQ